MGLPQECKLMTEGSCILSSVGSQGQKITMARGRTQWLLQETKDNYKLQQTREELEKTEKQHLEGREEASGEPWREQSKTSESTKGGTRHTPGAKTNCFVHVTVKWERQVLRYVW